MRKILFILSLLFLSKAQAQYSGEIIAESNYQWTGITISKQQRIFVNFPAWDVASPYQVAEVVHGETLAYPSKKDNQRFVCVQSVVIDSLDHLWILDPANPQFKGVVAAGAKLYRVNLQTNKIERTYSFSSRIVPKASYLNDIRIDTKRHIAYITDSGMGGIIVINLKNGTSWRALDSSVAAVRSNLQSINFSTTGKWTNKVHSDGIELSPDGNTLYFTALSGNILYSIPTKVLRDKSWTVKQRAEKITTENAENVPTDGMLLTDNKLLMGNLPKESIWQYDLQKKKGSNIELGFPVRWADSFTADKEGNIYFTTSQINYPVEKRIRYKIIRMKKTNPNHLSPNL